MGNQVVLHPPQSLDVVPCHYDHARHGTGPGQSIPVTPDRTTLTEHWWEMPGDAHSSLWDIYGRSKQVKLC